MDYIFGERWRSIGGETAPICSPTMTFAREFRYDSPRQRYLVRELDPTAAKNGTILPSAFVADQWSDYVGDTVYGDWEVGTVNDQPYLDDTRLFEPGLARTLLTGPSPVTRYEHTDLLGTSKLDSRPDGSSTPRETYTAFGERVCSFDNSCPQIDPFERYGYVGAHGYQANKDFPFLHVGARYYDPSTGRFLQRDPIGIAGGLNVYSYVGNAPTAFVDPSGNGPIDWLYTGQWNPAPGVRDAAVDAAGGWMLNRNPVRGGFIGVGVGRNRGPVAGAGVQWTIDDGASAFAGAGWAMSRGGRDPSSGRFESTTFAVGGGISYGGNGFSGSLDVGAGRNQKGHGGFAGGSPSGQFSVGINVGPVGGGLIIEPGRIFGGGG